MGNTVLTCYKSRATVAVILADGKVEEYFKPVRVSTVLQRHPKHMIVKLNSPCKLTQRRRKMTFMRPEQTLKGKRQYVVLPNQSVGGKFVDCWALASKALESNARRAKLKKFKGKKHTAKLCSVYSAFNYTDPEQDNFITSLLDSPPQIQAGTYSSGMNQGVGLNNSKPRHREYEWRPSLDSIPESPGLRPLLAPFDWK